ALHRSEAAPGTKALSRIRFFTLASASAVFKFCLSQSRKETDEMHSLKPLLIASAAIAGLAILAPAVARELNSHQITVPVPGGGVATIEYSGNVAPKVSFRPVAGPQLADPFAWSPAFDMPSFVALDSM